MDNSIVLGFPDTSGDYKGLVSIEPCTNGGRCPDLGPDVQLLTGLVFCSARRFPSSLCIFLAFITELSLRRRLHDDAFYEYGDFSIHFH